MAFLFTFQTTVAYLSSLTLNVDPAWLVNLTNTCGEIYEKDVYGNYIVTDKFAQFFADSIPFIAGNLTTVLGLYIGQLVFRYKGLGRLGPDAFSSESPIKQTIYAISLMLLT